MIRRSAMCALCAVSLAWISTGEVPASAQTKSDNTPRSDAGRDCHDAFLG